MRTIRREFSRRLARAEPDAVIAIAKELLEEGSDRYRFVAYELVCQNRRAFESLRTDELRRLGEGIDSWASVDTFASYLSGPLWLREGVSDATVARWARSKDRWWRRAALVSTIALSRRGDAEALVKVTRICALLVADRDDMVVKALSWALRELSKKHPKQAARFLAEHREGLAARVAREVSNKLTTRLKTPRKGHTVKGRGTSGR